MLSRASGGEALSPSHDWSCGTGQFHGETFAGINESILVEPMRGNMTIFFDIMLVLCVVSIIVFSGYVLYRLVTDESNLR